MMAVDQIARMMALDAAQQGGGTTDNYTKAETDALLDGKADLVGGKIPSSELPSYVDDVVEYASTAAFPATGESGKIYVATDTNTSYRWSGSTYIPFPGQADWNQTDTNAPDYIKNKPTIPAAVTVDQVYDGTSANPQSGIAINSVIGNINTVLEEVL